MKQLFLTLSMIMVLYSAIAQQKKYIGAAIVTTQNAMPFGKFVGLFKETIHPGIEFHLGKNFKTMEKHDWFGELRAGYFLHRFVQHGLPISINAGYRYKFTARFSAQASIGGGYMHSIPATAKLKADQEGNYTNDKGVGRMQASATFDIGLAFIPDFTAKKQIRFFITYQQRIQMPFVKSYVPLLPYNNFLFGFSKPISR